MPAARGPIARRRCPAEQHTCDNGGSRDRAQGSPGANPWPPFRECHIERHARPVELSELRVTLGAARHVRVDLGGGVTCQLAIREQQELVFGRMIHR
jgi:hypothetical protein